MKIPILAIVFVLTVVITEARTVEYSGTPANPQGSVEAQKSAVASQPQFYNQHSLKFAPQYQYEPQTVAYAQQSKIPAKQYSQAGDVSSFSYSSPLVSYNSLGLLSQLAGNLREKVAPSQKVTYVPVQKPHKVVYAQAPSPVVYKQALAAAPQQVYQQAPQIAYVQQTPQSYSQTYPQAYPQPQASQQETYSQQSQAYSQGPQTFSQQVPQASYVQASQYVPPQVAQSVLQPQYFAVPQKYATPGVTYAQ